MAPLVAEFQFTASWLLDLLVAVGVFATLAASLNLVTGYAGMFSLGHHGFFMVGAYAAAWFTSVFASGDPGSASSLLVMGGSALAAMTAAYLSGVLIGVPCLRLRGDYLAIATLAFAEIVRIVVQNTDALGKAEGIYVPRLLMDPSGQVDAFRVVFVVLAFALLAATLLWVRNLVRSAHGRAIVSVREDEVAAEILGVWTTRAKLRAFLTGSALAGLAGWLFAHYNGDVGPGNFDFLVGIKVLLIVVLGGLGSLSGTVIAAFLLLGLERLLQTGVFGDTLKDWMQVEYALALILLMLLRPNGILGNRELTDLFRRPPAPPPAAPPAKGAEVAG